MRKENPRRPEGPVRLQTLLARAGVASRRRAERMIEAGRVAVNGRVVRTLGTKADPACDAVTVDGEPLPPVETPVYYLLYKPVGVLSTMKDQRGRPTVADLLEDIPQRVYPVGRLDADTDGLLVVTNDGAVAQAILHPRHEVTKTYRALVAGHPSRQTMARLRRGVVLSDGPTAPARARIIRRGPDETWIELTLTEGRKHQVKRMCQAVGHPVRRLRRTAIEFLTLEGLASGEVRRLRQAEIRRLRALRAPPTG
ncbi:rRNA pseudouridine synthase [Nitrospinae bacterium AH_259_B05_G02_I21]|nr:rRNA pseudouridine synthase [Nitrospinae bacterium AH_259_B05_G02_I21]